MRGKDRLLDLFKLVIRITPAYAGKSTFAELLDVILGDHPRVCGEKHFVAYIPSSWKGSPPRMRGKALSRSF